MAFLFRLIIFVVLMGYGAHQPQASIKLIQLKDTLFSQKTTLRVGSWDSQVTPAHGTVILLTGRASFMEKNLELIEYLTSQGFHVETFDWRGHGGSERLLANRQLCHIDSFDTYLGDLDQYLQDYVQPRRPGPWLLVGISLGGHLALRYAHDHEEKFSRVALVVPMVDMSTKPYPRWMVGPLATWMTWIGFGNTYAFGYKDIDLSPVKNPSPPPETHDLEQHEKTWAVMRAHPEYVVAGPTFGWVRAADASIRATQYPGYKLSMPVQMHMASDDKLVDNGATQALCQRMSKNCQSMTYEGSYHNITKETKPIREKFFLNLVTFLKEK